MYLAMLWGWQPVEKEQVLLSVGGALAAAVGGSRKVKGQYRAITEGFLEAEEVGLAWKDDEVGTRQESALPVPPL